MSHVTKGAQLEGIDSGLPGGLSSCLISAAEMGLLKW